MNLHAGERIHGRYSIASPSVHTIGGVLAIAKLSVLYTDKTTFQNEEL